VQPRGSFDSRHRRTRADDEGFTLIELLVIMIILAILAATVVFFLSGTTDKGLRAACASDARTVGIAAQAYMTENPEVTQVTEAALTAQGTGTLDSWPSGDNGAYKILIAGDSNALVGEKDANGVTIEANNVVVNIGAQYFDASLALPSACNALEN